MPRAFGNWYLVLKRTARIVFQSVSQSANQVLKVTHIFTWKKCLCGIRIRLKLTPESVFLFFLFFPCFLSPLLSTPFRYFPLFPLLSFPSSKSFFSFFLYKKFFFSFIHMCIGNFDRWNGVCEPNLRSRGMKNTRAS